MAIQLTTSQSTLLLQSKLTRIPRFLFVSSPWHLPFSLKTPSFSERSRFFSKGIARTNVASESKAADIAIYSKDEKENVEVNSSGGDGVDDISGSGGGGGGGGGDGGNGDNDDGEGKGEGEGEEKKKSGISMSQKLTLGYALLVGLGGVMGYVKSGSLKSLAAGVISASLLYFVYLELPVRPTLASSVGLGLSAALLGVMGSRYKKSGKIFPAGVVSLVSLIMTGGYLHGIMRTMH